MTTAESIVKLRNIYSIKPGAPFYLQDFGYYCLDEWRAEGKIDAVEKHDDYYKYLRELFGFDPPARHGIGGTGYNCHAQFEPFFDEIVLEDRGAHELVQDTGGRHVLCFAGRRNGFMPEYVDHPVKDMKSYMEKCEWRMDPNTPARITKNEETGRAAEGHYKNGLMISQGVIGGYMYLRALVGPEPLLFMFYDDPELIHVLMRKWLELTDAVMARYQKYVEYDEIVFDEDICYNHGSLISFDMINEFLIPYYQQLIQNVKKRSKNGGPPFIYLGTDGKTDGVIPFYKEKIGANVWGPNEVASGNDVVKFGRQYEDIVLTGGVDKRVLATTKDEIDRHLDSFLPIMRKRGGFIPTCDHGVPAEVSFENYVHYRRRVAEYGQ